MATKKKTNKTKKTSAPKTAQRTAPKAAAVEKISENKKCSCENCNCAHNSFQRSQVSFYLFIAILVAVLTTLGIATGLNIAIKDWNDKNTAIAYKGRFDSDAKGEAKDSNNITLLSAGAVVDMIGNDKVGMLIVGEENCLSCESFARQVTSYVDDSVSGIYRYNASWNGGKDIEKANSLLGIYSNEQTPNLLFIKNGVVYDRLDDVHSYDNIGVFLEKYGFISVTESE